MKRPYSWQRCDYCGTNHAPWEDCPIDEYIDLTMGCIAFAGALALVFAWLYCWFAAGGSA